MPFLFLLLCNFGGCTAETVVNQSRNEAAEQLKAGDISFILNMDLSEIPEISRIHPSAPFYAGLLVQAAALDKSGDTTEAKRVPPEDLAVALFKTALKSTSGRVREAAAQKLIIPVLEKRHIARQVLDRIETGFTDDTPSFVSLRGAALYRLADFEEAAECFERYGVSSSWDQAVSLLALLRQTPGAAGGKSSPETFSRNVLGFFLSGVPDQAYRWALSEIQTWAAPDFFTEAEQAAIAGRLALSRSSFGEGMKQFRLVLNQNRSLFFQYPALLTELGRAFLGTGALAEGVNLFLEWDDALSGEIEPSMGGEGVPVIDMRNIRFRLYYFAGRMERQRGHPAQGAAYFTQALLFAPDAQQEDACIWYILQISLGDKPEDLPALVYTYLPRWNVDSYFSDILDGLCRYLTAKRQWKSMLTVFSLIKSRSDGVNIAKYAYILGRAVSLGYIPPGEAASYVNISALALAGPAEALKTTVAQTFFRIAFEEGQASFYYRALSASYLGETMAPIPMEPEEPEKPAWNWKKKAKHAAPREFVHNEEMELLLGFFEFGAASYITPYLEELRDTLSLPELRTIAAALAVDGQWIALIRLITYCTGREDYEVTHFDMEHYYPRPFQDLIEQQAQDAGVPVEILYGLIRTESAFTADIVSHAGAIGLTQLMPQTALEEAGRILKQGGPNYIEGGTIPLRDPGINVHIGASYLGYLIERLKSPLLALLSYNGGMNRIRRWRSAESKFPEDLFLETIEYTETREYGKRVLAAAAAYGFLYYNLSMEEVVADILK
ncbi:MAG: lytic transglycosylase domain-containing protein [Treponema sp.]|nr:lytic transglycosylase domain-containing protein [Treponema sp.]